MSTANEPVGEAVPASQRGSWSSFLKSVASFSGDLSSLTAPPFILSPTSLTEFPAYWCERPDLFAAIADAKSGEQRHLAVLRWFISTLKDQYTSRNEELGSEKKPLNPVLGELFYGYLPDKNGRGQTNLLVEQVSHHPPITAYVIENKTKNITLTGHNAQKTTFSAGAIIVKQIGHAVLTVQGVEYLITLPRLRIDGLWYGSPYIELIDTSYIVGEGFVSVIEYSGKGYFSGKSHSFKATVTPASPDAPVVAAPSSGGGGLSSWYGGGRKSASASSTSLALKEHVIEGTWHETSAWVKGGKGPFHDMKVAKEEFIPVGGEPDGSMGGFETRQLWKLVAKGIKEADFEAASKEKSRIENEQRQMRKDEQAAGTKWPLKHFTLEASDPVYERLGKLVKLAPPSEDKYSFTGVWPPSLVPK